MRRTSFAPPPRRRTRRWPVLLAGLLLLAGLMVWLATIDTKVEPARIEQDVTNEILAS